MKALALYYYRDLPGLMRWAYESFFRYGQDVTCREGLAGVLEPRVDSGGDSCRMRDVDLSTAVE